MNGRAARACQRLQHARSGEGPIFRPGKLHRQQVDEDGGRYRMPQLGHHLLPREQDAGYDSGHPIGRQQSPRQPLERAAGDQVPNRRQPRDLQQVDPGHIGIVGVEGRRPEVRSPSRPNARSPCGEPASARRPGPPPVPAQFPGPPAPRCHRCRCRRRLWRSGAGIRRPCGQGRSRRAGDRGFGAIRRRRPHRNRPWPCRTDARPRTANAGAPPAEGPRPAPSRRHPSRRDRAGPRRRPAVADGSRRGRRAPPSTAR